MLGYSRPTTGSQTQGEMPVVKSEAPSLGWVVAGASFAAFDCRVSHRHLASPSAADG